MPSQSLWSIRIVDKLPFVFHGPERLTKKNAAYGVIRRADEAVRNANKVPCIELSFEPDKNGRRQTCKLPMVKYDWSQSHGIFKEIVGMENEQQWADKCNECLKSLKTKDIGGDLDTNSGSAEVTPTSGNAATSSLDCLVELNTSSNGDHDNLKGVEDLQIQTGEKRSLADVTDMLTLPSKRQRSCSNGNEDLSMEIKNQKRTEECRIDGQFCIPVEKISLPPKERLLRNVDKLFLDRLKTNMEKHPNGAYEPLYVHVKALKNKNDFDTRKLEEYEYEVLGGTHNLLATKALLEEHPERVEFAKRYASVFAGLADNEALWLATRHNLSGSFRHQMTFQDEVNVAYLQLEKAGTTSKEWRETCSQILGKSKKNLCEVFAMASLCPLGWESFTKICKKYEQGKLKDQRALPKDLIGKPTLRPSYVRYLHGLDMDDRVEILKKVAEGENNLDEMKLIADQLKAIRPVQKLICSFLGKKWEEVEEKIVDLVLPQYLERFAGKKETDSIVINFLQNIQKMFNGEKSSQSDTMQESDLYRTDRQQAVIFQCDDFSRVEQQDFGQRECGFALTIYKMQDNLQEENLVEHGEHVIKLVEKLNFGSRQVFNVAIWGDVSSMVKLRNHLRSVRGSCMEIGFVNQGNAKSSGTLEMVESVTAIIIFHAAISKKMLPEHFNVQYASTPGNLLCPDAADDAVVYEELIRRFSHPDDWILDITSSQGLCVKSALACKRNDVGLCKGKDEHYSASRRLAKFLATASFEDAI